MLRPLPAALWRAVVMGSVLTGAVCAPARTAFAFEQVPRVVPEHHSYAGAYVVAATGAALIGASFPLADAADRRYAEYLNETRPGEIVSRWDRTVWADRTASGALLTGEALLALGAYLRFIHQPHAAHVALAVTPSRCVVSCSF